MFSRKFYSEMRRSGLGVGVSKAKLSEAMLEVLLQLPVGSGNLKERVVARLGLLGQMAATRDINDAWNQTKKRAAKLYPEKFTLDRRSTLTWNDGTTKELDRDISSANIRKLNDLASAEGCTVNAIVAKLLKTHSQGKG